jgi:hypothetical protein
MSEIEKDNIYSGWLPVEWLILLNDDAEESVTDESHQQNYQVEDDVSPAETNNKLVYRSVVDPDPVGSGRLGTNPDPDPGLNK